MGRSCNHSFQRKGAEAQRVKGEVARLAALVPPSRMPLVHAFGILAPKAKLRRFVVPEPPEPGGALQPERGL
jgi:hypothetical protein